MKNSPVNSVVLLFTLTSNALVSPKEYTLIPPENACGTQLYENYLGEALNQVSLLSRDARKPHVVLCLHFLGVYLATSFLICFPILPFHLDISCTYFESFLFALEIVA